MIRTSNQLSPKSKVVDLLFLYNFYFGQNSSANMKFGVLSGQILAKPFKPGSTAPLLAAVPTRRRTGDYTRRRARVSAVA